MSAISEALSALKNVVLMQERLDSMRAEQKRIAEDMSGLGDVVSDVRDRISRLEGIIEGAAMAAGSRAGQPPQIEG